VELEIGSIDNVKRFDMGEIISVFIPRFFSMMDISNAEGVSGSLQVMEYLKLYSRGQVQLGGGFLDVGCSTGMAMVCAMLVGAKYVYGTDLAANEPVMRYGEMHALTVRQELNLDRHTEWKMEAGQVKDPVDMTRANYKMSVHPETILVCSTRHLILIVLSTHMILA
jgi:hypothetical protein